MTCRHGDGGAVIAFRKATMVDNWFEMRSGQYGAVAMMNGRSELMILEEEVPNGNMSLYITPIQ
jgi:hypothetical protein